MSILLNGTTIFATHICRQESMKGCLLTEVYYAMLLLLK